MNMNNASRHIACKLCRDRKVRCDGATPSCEKCRRSGEACIYVPTHKPTKADLAQTIESLQERLDKAEAYILKHSGKPGLSDRPALTATPNSNMSLDFLECSAFNQLPLSTPGMSTSGDQFMSAAGMPPTPFSQHSLPISPETIDSDFLNYLRSQRHGHHTGLSGDPSQFSMDDQRQMDDMSVSGAPPSTSYRRESVYSHRKMPSVREMRVINGSSTSTTPPPASPSGRGPRPDDANHILAELTAFAMTVFHTQAEIAGISSVLAEYLEWMRHTPTADTSDPKENPVVLETLESRLRELNALANTKHAEAWRQSVTRLERLPGVSAMLNLFDGEMQRRSAEAAEFFRTNYNICAPLSEQQLARKGELG
ncbi:hypothetical protein F5Y16DRAFT_276643 [Xylariaceae sp. FL0255]|nr:hypothetical protein F5Y16DRAFT_276643 [Xylariaceae sp. FL0255]